jgi:anion-transporting  ArsA/GET3 family ATPase
MAVERIDQLIRRGVDNLVIDTAPARHALDIFDKPVLFADFSESGKVRFVSRTYKFAEALGLTAIGRSALEVYGRVESIMGTNLVKEILDFYSLFHPIAEGYAERARETVALLRDPDVTEFCVVTIPDKALRDARFYVGELKKRDFATGMICVNRTWSHAMPPPVSEGFAAELLDWYGAVSASHQRSIEKLRETLGAEVKEIRILRELERDVEGLESLRRLADQLEPAVAHASSDS